MQKRSRGDERLFTRPLPSPVPISNGMAICAGVYFVKPAQKCRGHTVGDKFFEKFPTITIKCDQCAVFEKRKVLTLKRRAELAKPRRRQVSHIEEQDELPVEDELRYVLHYVRLQFMSFNDTVKNLLYLWSHSHLPSLYTSVLTSTTSVQQNNTAAG